MNMAEEALAKALSTLNIRREGKEIVLKEEQETAIIGLLLTRQFISIYIREPQKSRGIISYVRKKYISRSTQIFSPGLIRGIEKSGLFTCIRRIGHFLNEQGTRY